jgi:hypothetical protein
MSDVWFNAPVVGEIKGPAPEVPAIQQYFHRDIIPIIDALKADGIDDRAVVVRRTGTEFYRASPNNWGIVIDLNRNHSNMNEPYAPIKVKWVDGSISSYWREELYIMHKALLPFEVTTLVKEQDA